MICRIWIGAVPAEAAGAYRAYQLEVGPAGYRRVPGNRAVLVLERALGERHELGMLTLWSSWEAVRAFAGEPLDRARYYARDHGFLIDPPELVEHFEVRGGEPDGLPDAARVALRRSSVATGEVAAALDRARPGLAGLRATPGNRAALLLERVPSSAEGPAPPLREVTVLTAWDARGPGAEEGTTFEVVHAEAGATR